KFYAVAQRTGTVRPVAVGVDARGAVAVSVGVAGVAQRAGATVVTRERQRLRTVDATEARIAAGKQTSVRRLLAHHAASAGARAGAIAHFAGRAGVGVVALGARDLKRVRADARLRIARAHLEALAERRAADRLSACAHTCLAGVALGALVAVVAAGVVGQGRVGTSARLRITRAGFVALITGAA